MPFAPGKALITESSIKDIYDANYREKFKKYYLEYADRTFSAGPTDLTIDNYLKALLEEVLEIDPLAKEETDVLGDSPSPFLRQILTWVLWFMDKEYKAGSISSPIGLTVAMRSRYPMKENLEQFYGLLKVLPPELRAINRFKTPIDLLSFMQLEAPAYEKQAEEALVAKESSVFYEDDEWLAIIPKSHKASCHFGKGTEWCTATPRSSNYFNQYTNHGTLLMCMNKADKADSIQLFFPSEGASGEGWTIEIRDSEDRKIAEADVTRWLSNGLSTKITEKFGVDFSADSVAEVDRLYRGLTAD